MGSVMIETKGSQLSSRANQGKCARYASGSSSHSRQSAETEHVEFDNTRFIGPLQQARFYSLAERQIWSEKIFTLNPQGDCRYFVDDIEKRKWGVLLNPPTKLNFDIIQEFYANAMEMEDVGYSYCSFVRGRALVHFKRHDMNTKAQLYETLLLYNIKPRSHALTIPIDTDFLLHYMIKGWQIDVARVISNKIRRIAISGHSHGNKVPMTLGFPALITGLCRKVGVDIPNMATKRISSIVNEDYVLRYCVSKLAGEEAPQTQVHAPPTGSTWYNEQQACVYNWKMMDAHMRASFFLHDSIQLLYRHQVWTVPLGNSIVMLIQ
ncbi:hypothetical protein RYX36_029877 [Vicia faba]